MFNKMFAALCAVAAMTAAVPASATTLTIVATGTVTSDITQAWVDNYNVYHPEIHHLSGGPFTLMMSMFMDVPAGTPDSFFLNGTFNAYTFTTNWGGGLQGAPLTVVDGRVQSSSGTFHVGGGCNSGTYFQFAGGGFTFADHSCDGTPAAFRDFNASGSTIRYAINGVNAVPEPATWALMILGFGGIGAKLRRSRFAVAL